MRLLVVIALSVLSSIFAQTCNLNCASGTCFDTASNVMDCLKTIPFNKVCFSE